MGGVLLASLDRVFLPLTGPGFGNRFSKIDAALHGRVCLRRVWFALFRQESRCGLNCRRSLIVPAQKSPVPLGIHPHQNGSARWRSPLVALYDQPRLGATWAKWARTVAPPTSILDREKRRDLATNSAPRESGGWHVRRQVTAGPGCEPGARLCLVFRESFY
jgi:hypothetical protein